MEINPGHIEKLLMASDFSRETDLKERLAARLFPTKKVSLDDLMEAEGIRNKESRPQKTAKRGPAAVNRQRTIKPPVM